MNVDIFSNQILLESVILKDLKLEDITYLKKLLIIITSSSMEKTLCTGLRYYGNWPFLKRDLGILIKISSVFGISNISW